MFANGWLPILALLGMVSYVAMQPRGAYRGHWLLKALPVLLLMGWTLWSGVVLPLAFGLLFSAAGDVALALDRKRYFIVGLLFFLIGHAFYIAAFAPDAVWSAGRLPLLLGIGVAAVGATTLMWPGLGKLRLPVLAYIGIIAAMAGSAALRPGGTVVLLGALFFMASDAMIGLDKFYRPLPHAHFWIMITYYLGQFLIAGGMVLAL